MTDFKTVIALWGTASNLARDIGEKDVTVRAWGNRGNIPPRYWPSIERAAKRRGFKTVTVATLAEIACR